MIRAWEVELMYKLGYDAVKYGAIPVTQRARMICAMRLSGWFANLEQELRDREAKLNGAGNT